MEYKLYTISAMIRKGEVIGHMPLAGVFSSEELAIQHTEEFCQENGHEAVSVIAVHIEPDYVARWLKHEGII